MFKKHSFIYKSFLYLTLIITSTQSFSFKEHIISKVQTDGAYYAKSIDVDNDGDMDFISASHDSNLVAWHENDGNQNFTMHKIADDIQSIRHFIAVDIDYDNDVDVLTSRNELTFFLNDGTGNFTRKLISDSISGRPATFRVADMDGDGMLDVIAEMKSQLYWYKNLSNGILDTAVRITNDYNAVLPVDIDKDNDIDLVIADYIVKDFGTEGHIFLLYNNGSGHFSQAASIERELDFIENMDAADVDNDGYLDLLVGHYDGGISTKRYLVWYRSDSTGNFNKYKTSRVSNISSLFPHDFDNDGDIDIFTSCMWDDEIVLHEIISGTSHSITKYVIDSNAISAQHISGADIDGDGDIDLYSASSSDNLISWYENKGHLNYKKHRITDYPRSILKIISTDLNQDGNQDILMSSSSDNNVIWYENISGGEFKNHILDTSMDSPEDILTEDIDNDNDMDIIIADKDDDQILCLLNDGTQNFTLDTLANEINGVIHIAIADINGDSIKDIAATSTYDSLLVWYKQENQFQFSPNIVTDTFFNADDLEAIDINKDNHIDFLALSKYGNYLALFKNNGNGEFEKIIISSERKVGKAICTGDFDNDGNYDIISLSHENPELVIHRNEGNSNFEDIIIIDSASKIRSMHPIDLDSDGNLDLITVSGKELLFLKNDGSCQFKKNTILNNLKSGSHISAADYNNDGKNDILYYGGGNGVIAWLENTGNTAAINTGIATRKKIKIINNQNSKIRFIFPMNSYSTIELKIFNAAGKLIDSVLKSVNKENQLIWNRSTKTFNRGIYFYQLVGDGDKISSGKFMLIK